MSCIARGVLRGWRTAWCSVRPNRTLCCYRASGESESTAKVEVNERHISDGMGVVRVVHRAGEVKRGRRKAASLSEGGLLEEMWWREVPVKWRAEGRRFQGEETAAAKVQRCVDWSVWKRKSQCGKGCRKTLPQERANSGAEIAFKTQKAGRFYGAIKPGPGAWGKVAGDT